MRFLTLLCVVMTLNAPAFAQSCADVVCVRVETSAERAVFFVHNTRAVPTHVTLWFPTLENVTPSASVPHAVTVPAGTEQEALTLTYGPGRWHYTYRFDWQNEPAMVRRALVCVAAERTAEAFRLVARNRLGSAATLLLSLGDAAPDTLELAPETTAVVLRLPAGAPSPRFRYTWTPGRPRFKADTTYAYALPYPPGHTYVLVRGPSPDAGPQNRHGHGWEVPAGTPVRAAREGIVMAVMDSVLVIPWGRPVLGSERPAEIDGRPTGNASLRVQAVNYVFVAHADGTVGRYLNLARASARVAVGDRVGRGDVLAEAAGPVLSFGLMRLEGREQGSLPVRFLVGGQAVLLDVGAQATASQ